jgi:membrane protein implicated in regulation of membrane protease activity
MDAWVVWAVIAVALTVGEVLTVGFYLLPFAVGAAAAAVADLAGAGSTIQALAFVVVTALFFGVVRPIARRHVSMPPALRTGTAALVGQTAMVVEDICNDDARGKVRLDGEVWTARAYDEDELIPAGRRVTVIDIKGATALVAE